MPYFLFINMVNFNNISDKLFFFQIHCDEKMTNKNVRATIFSLKFFQNKP